MKKSKMMVVAMFLLGLCVVTTQTQVVPHSHKDNVCFTQKWGNYSCQRSFTLLPEYQTPSMVYGSDSINMIVGKDKTTWLHRITIYGKKDFVSYMYADTDPRPDLVRLVNIHYEYTSSIAEVYHEEFSWWNVKINPPCTGLFVHFRGIGRVWKTEGNNKTSGYVSTDTDQVWLSKTLGYMPHPQYGWTRSFGWYAD